MTYLDTLKQLAQAATQPHQHDRIVCRACKAEAELARSAERILQLLAVIEAAKEYVAAADQSAEASVHADDVAAMLRYGKADTAIRAALAALERGGE